MEDKILIIMTSGPDTPHRCATPFFYASLGVAMDYEVSMFFTMDGSLLLKKGVAEKVFPKKDGKPVSDFLHDAMDAGVQFTACTASLELHDLQPGDLIEGVKLVGGASMWQMAEDSKTLTF
jgi:predicted peroxiredoxin